MVSEIINARFTALFYCLRETWQLNLFNCYAIQNNEMIVLRFTCYITLTWKLHKIRLVFWICNNRRIKPRPPSRILCLRPFYAPLRPVSLRYAPEGRTVVIATIASHHLNILILPHARRELRPHVNEVSSTRTQPHVLLFVVEYLLNGQVWFDHLRAEIVGYWWCWEARVGIAKGLGKTTAIGITGLEIELWG